MLVQRERRAQRPRQSAQRPPLQQPDCARSRPLRGGLLRHGLARAVDPPSPELRCATLRDPALRSAALEPDMPTSRRWSEATISGTQSTHARAPDGGCHLKPQASCSMIEKRPSDRTCDTSHVQHTTTTMGPKASLGIVVVCNSACGRLMRSPTRACAAVRHSLAPNTLVKPDVEDLVRCYRGYPG